METSKIKGFSVKIIILLVRGTLTFLKVNVDIVEKREGIELGQVPS